MSQVDDFPQGVFDGDVGFDEETYLYPGERDDLACPKCGTGRMRLVRARDGRRFYGCDHYPQCPETRDAAPDGSPLPSNFGKKREELRPPPKSVWQRLMEKDPY